MMLVAAGLDYIEAASDELTELARRRGPELMGVISCGGDRDRLPSALQPFRLPAGIEWEEELPGVRSYLNSRILEWVIQQMCEMTTPSIADLRLLMERRTAALVRSSKNRPHKDLIRKTDDDVIAWVQAALRQRPDASKSELLRLFRGEASCEQARFGRLVDAARNCGKHRVVGDGL
jgi:hypothetical protein